MKTFLPSKLHAAFPRILGAWHAFSTHVLQESVMTKVGDLKVFLILTRGHVRERKGERDLDGKRETPTGGLPTAPPPGIELRPFGE